MQVRRAVPVSRRQVQAKDLKRPRFFTNEGARLEIKGKNGTKAVLTLANRERVAFILRPVSFVGRGQNPSLRVVIKGSSTRRATFDEERQLKELFGHALEKWKWEF